MFLVVGLGNPGERYAATRHNVGFMVVDELAREAEPWVQRFRGSFSLLRVGAERVGLLKPQTYMNLSGESVRPAIDFYKISAERVLVAHDELDLEFGGVRLKFGGGEAGHRGLRSLSQNLGTRDYHRLRIGIGRPPGDFAGSPADFVLQAFAPAEAGQLDDLVQRSANAARLWIERGAEAAMNEVNRKR